MEAAIVRKADTFLREEVIEMGESTEQVSLIERSMAAIDDISQELYHRLQPVMAPSDKVDESPENQPAVLQTSLYADRLRTIELRLTEILERLEV